MLANHLQSVLGSFSRCQVHPPSNLPDPLTDKSKSRQVDKSARSPQQGKYFAYSLTRWMNSFFPPFESSHDAHISGKGFQIKNGFYFWPRFDSFSQYHELAYLKFCFKWWWVGIGWTLYETNALPIVTLVAKKSSALLRHFFFSNWIVVESCDVD